MSRSCTATDSHQHARVARRAGFMLLEVLVALVVAALFLGLLAQVLAGAWQGNRRPMERVTALNIARNIAADMVLRGRFARDGRIGRFAYTAETAPLMPEARQADLAPAPGGLAMDRSRTGNAPVAALQRISISIRGPSGRELSLETIRRSIRE